MWALAALCDRALIRLALELLGREHGRFAETRRRTGAGGSPIDVREVSLTETDATRASPRSCSLCRHAPTVTPRANAVNRKGTPDP